ncbi:MAG: ADP-glyceromanno-heptose 6-epimerase [Tunicatimonas sp.]|uniref:ADP-glyceromanno-heptose 6-epimerase n=1 Tax=Tunicatimonas sp. TaxID=1940096 RepID=UPI003C73B921
MIIVTGGAGFIGSNLIKGLNELGHEDILVIDNLANAQKHLNLNGLFIADFLDKKDFLAALPFLQNITAIFHQGACSSTTETDGEYMMRNNYQFSKALLHHCVDRQIPFYYASSASVYGNGDNGFAEERKSEYPLNVYAFSKFMFDQYVLRYLKANAVSSPVVGLRYFNVYGYQENHKGNMASVVFHFYNQLQEGGKMRLFEGSEDFRRDFIFVEDVVRVNLHFFQQAQSGVFNCGTGEARSFLNIAHIIQSLEDKETKIEFIPFPDHLKGKYQTFTQANLQALRDIGYTQPFTSLEEGVKRYYQRLQSHHGLFTSSFQLLEKN